MTGDWLTLSIGRVIVLEEGRNETSTVLRVGEKVI